MWYILIELLSKNNDIEEGTKCLNIKWNWICCGERRKRTVYGGIDFGVSGSFLGGFSKKILHFPGRNVFIGKFQ